MKNKRTILWIGILVIIITGGTFRVSLTSGRDTYKFELNGLLWVVLDYWSINKYQSTDTPKSFITYKHSIK